MIEAIGWNVDSNGDLLKIFRDDPEYILTKSAIHTDCSFGFSVRIFDWLLPDNHQIYTESGRSAITLTLTSLMLVARSATASAEPIQHQIGISRSMVCQNTMKSAYRTLV